MSHKSQCARQTLSTHCGKVWGKPHLKIESFRLFRVENLGKTLLGPESYTHLTVDNCG